MNNDRSDLPFLTLMAQNVGTWNVYIEPWGTQFSLGPNDALFVHSAALARGEVGITHFPDGVAIYFNNGEEPRVFDGAGVELPF